MVLWMLFLFLAGLLIYFVFEVEYPLLRDQSQKYDGLAKTQNLT
jgi:hypothetical protein